MRAAAPFLAMILLLCSCYKEGAGPEELRHNPFDPAYDGEPVVRHFATNVESYVEQAETFYRLRVRFEVRTDMLPSQTWRVRARRLPAGPEAILVASETVNGVFPQIVFPFTSGTEYCWDVVIGNSGSWARTERICVIAP